MSIASHQSENDHAGRGIAPAASDRTALDWAREAGEADRVVRDLEDYLTRRRRRRMRVGVVALAVVLLGGVSWPSWRHAVWPDSADGAARLVVLRPETRALNDGSIVELNAGAEIEVNFSGALRRVALRKGEAHFQVAKDAQRPFVVAAGGVEVRAVGTAFSVGLGRRAVEVLVTEGRVAVGQPVSPATPPSGGESSAMAVPVAPAAPVTLGAGRRIVVALGPGAGRDPAADAVAVPALEMDERLAWRVPRLEFVGTPLADALPMFNKYGRVRLVLGDATLGRLQLSGVLRADSTDSLLRLLEGEFGVVAERRADEIVLRRR